ncbi:hypothetical protein VTK26DRAFT_1061 [Humicola hyalothermophila]
MLTITHYNHRPNLQVTPSTGSGSAVAAERVLMNTMLMNRDLLTALRNQDLLRKGHRTLNQLSVGIIGFGSMGQQVSERSLALGCAKATTMNPTGFPPPSGPGPASATQQGARPSVSQAASVVLKTPDDKDELRTFLGQQDVLALAAPLTSGTIGLIGAPELAALPPNAIVINVARGPRLDENVLAECLRSGHLGGAALDVATEECP